MKLKPGAGISLPLSKAPNGPPDLTSPSDRHIYHDNIRRVEGLGIQPRYEYILEYKLATEVLNYIPSDPTRDCYARHCLCATDVNYINLNITILI